MEKEDHHTHQKELQLLPIPQPPPPPPQPPPPPSPSTTWFLPPLPPDPSTSHRQYYHPFKPPQPPSLPSTSLDLQLSISCADPHTTTRSVMKRVMKKNINNPRPDNEEPPAGAYIQALRWQAAQESRLAGMERAYAERMREMTRREMEMAHSEFARARAVWERAREEVTRAERMKESSIHQVLTAAARSKVDHQSSSTTSENIYNSHRDNISSTHNTSNSNCIEITCHSCRQRFRP